MGDSRPYFDDVTSFEKFILYYWYRKELSQICKMLGLEYRGQNKNSIELLENVLKGIE